MNSSSTVNAARGINTAATYSQPCQLLIITGVSSDLEAVERWRNPTLPPGPVRRLVKYGTGGPRLQDPRDPRNRPSPRGVSPSKSGLRDLPRSSRGSAPILSGTGGPP